MISAIIVIGLCINFIVVLTIWAASKGFAETFKLLKEKITQKSASRRVCLTSEINEHFELKITALEDQPAISVYCPFPVAQIAVQHSSRSKSPFQYLRRQVARFARNLAGSSITSLRDNHVQYLPPVRGYNICATANCLPQPSSVEDGTSRQASSIHSARKRAVDSSRASRPETVPHPPKARSRLAVRLERKLPMLASSIEAARAIAKMSIISFKLEKLERSLAKKCAASGKSLLSAVPEVTSN